MVPATSEQTHSVIAVPFISSFILPIIGSMKRVVFEIIASVVQVFAPFHFLIDIVGLNLQQEAVWVSIDYLTFGAVLPVELITIKIIHENFCYRELSSQHKQTCPASHSPRAF